MTEPQTEVSSLLDHEAQERLLREAENAAVTSAHKEQMRYHLRSDGMGLALLGLLVNGRTLVREKIAAIPLEEGEKAVMQALKLQGQMKGIDFAIDAVFEIVNFEEELKQENQDG